MVEDIFESALYLETTGCNVFNSLFIMYFTVWKADQYRWYQNGTKCLPTGIPVVKKVYAVNVNDQGKNSDFKRSAYTLLDDANNERLTLIHYTGDHSTATLFPHGNSKKSKNLSISIGEGC